jgi:hypothetical protein
VSKSKSINTRARNVGLGLAALVATVIGVGVIRSRKGPQYEVVEESVYRGFRYRIEKRPLGSGQGFMAYVLAQTIGDVTFAEDTGGILSNLEDARRLVQQTIDKRLGPKLKATFVGTSAA